MPDRASSPRWGVEARVQCVVVVVPVLKRVLLRDAELLVSCVCDQLLQQGRFALTTTSPAEKGTSPPRGRPGGKHNLHRVVNLRRDARVRNTYACLACDADGVADYLYARLQGARARGQWRPFPGASQCSISCQASAPFRGPGQLKDMRGGFSPAERAWRFCRLGSRACDERPKRARQAPFWGFLNACRCRPRLLAYGRTIHHLVTGPYRRCTTNEMTEVSLACHSLWGGNQRAAW
jgi:hypothetical protein